MKFQNQSTSFLVLVTSVLAVSHFASSVSGFRSTTKRYSTSKSIPNVYQQQRQLLVVQLSSRRGEQQQQQNSEDSFYNQEQSSFYQEQQLRPKTSFGSEAVPENQRPVNEYLDVTSQPFFDWASKGNKGLLTRLVILYSVLFWVICYPISGATYTMDGYEIQKLACSNVGAICCILVLMIRLYSGWNYLGQRLTSKVIEYEETGWYDGQFEYKTETEMKRDRFLYNTDVKPVVERLTVFLYGTIAATVVSFGGLQVATTAKPLPFDQYNPTVLERLSYDDKLAQSASSSTAGKPAYCDSRYYQAIANGGQGCN